MVDPLLLGLGGVAAAGGLAGSIVASTTNNELQRSNRAELERLKRLQAAGQLGLDPVQQQRLQAELYNPVQRAAAEGRMAAEQQMASMGRASAGDLSRVRTEQARLNAAGARDAAMATRQADAQKKQAQRTEIQEREAAKAQYRKDDVSTILGGVRGGAGAAGALIGAGPDTLSNVSLAAGGLKQTPVAPAGLPAGAGLLLADMPSDEAQAVLDAAIRRRSLADVGGLMVQR
jgi:hypothetical protein